MKAKLPILFVKTDAFYGNPLAGFVAPQLWPSLLQN